MSREAPRRVGRRRLAAALSILVAMLAPATQARADDPPKAAPPQSEPAPEVKDPPAAEGPGEETLDDNRRIAREKGSAALKLYRAGEYEAAYPLFREADELFHTLPLVLYMARCQERRGKLLEARALYERVLREPLPEEVPESLTKARTAAMSALGPLRLRIPTLAIDVRGPPPEVVTLFVDGDVWPVGEPRELDPGGHEVEAIARTGARTGRLVELPEGRAVSILLRLGLFAPGASRTMLLEVPPDPQWSRIASGTAFGVGAAGVGVGAVAGFVVLGRSGRLVEACAKTCPPSARAEIDSTRTLGNVSTASFILGATGLATGVLILLLTPSPRRGVLTAGGVHFDMGLGGVMAEGQF
ncbi:tetratricopeptide repeat protein [Polyangium aurulentum]|uniref:tetratricopeptide repeat protein n=1 Tax=Polyangium aurulentum TaxID=2567896 RepID=UPI0010AE4CB9|nr:tetratricopeptide repeat protein [Polyangium aurulentum]UQA59508.1 tetratricopeptide repeat protein [Polyangium aurulentum]